MRVLTHNNSST
ncbi:hypothetical protein D047_0742A, partial [Vibrio parahaemolyticus VPTS-2010_2]